MARPRLGDEPYEKLTVRIDTGTMGEIAAYMEHLKATSMGLRVDLSGTARRLLLYGLQYAKDLERQEALRQSPGAAGGGPVEAPVPLGADQSPNRADQFLQKAARDRTTVRQGRKRTAAAKG